MPPTAWAGEPAGETIMQPQEIKTLLEAGLENCEITVVGNGNHFDVLAVGDIFGGQRPLKRQQMVYAILGEHIANGSIHAVNIKACTPDEWREQGR